jgi:hypothetical protein
MTSAVWAGEDDIVVPYVVPYCRFCNAPGGLHGGRPTFHWDKCNNEEDGPEKRVCECPKRMWKEQGYPGPRPEDWKRR